MSGPKALAILFSVLLVGALKESFRIFTSADAGIATNRRELIVIAVVITSLFLYLAIRFWRKAQNKQSL